jgi:hypothetical protein
MAFKQLLGSALASVMIFSSVAMMQQAQAGHYDGQGRYHADNGHHYGQYRDRYYDNRRHAWVSYKTGKILKGGLLGAGIGAGAGLLLDRNVGKSALAGAGIGAGAQAVRYSDTLRRHPIVKTGAYGALAGAGVSAATGKKLGKGAIVGGALGAGLGALSHY